MQIKATEIKQVDIDSIVPNPRNRNIHSDEQIERLCKIIKYSGYCCNSCASSSPFEICQDITLIKSNRSVMGGVGRIKMYQC